MPNLWRDVSGIAAARSHCSRCASALSNQGCENTYVPATLHAGHSNIFLDTIQILCYIEGISILSITQRNAMKQAVSAALVCALIGLSAIYTTSPAHAEDTLPEIITPLSDELAEAAENGASGAAELSAAVSLPLDGPGSLIVTPDGTVAATVTFTIRPSESDIDAIRALATINTVNRFTPSVAVTVSPDLLDELAELPGVISVAPALAPNIGNTRVAQDSDAAKLAQTHETETSCRAFPSDATGPLGVNLARETFGVDGTGVTIGIISDSFNSGKPSPSNPATDIAAGLLPGPGNPCGYETPVEVLADLNIDIDGRGDDEGRAMAQLVHGIAPGAKLIFHTGTQHGEESMAEGIVALAEAGATVIVDDIGFRTAPHFQQGVISAAITHVQSQGVAYYSSAGNGNSIGREGGSTNRAISAWQTTAFRSSACPEWVVPPSVQQVTWECLDFDPAGGGDPTDTLTFDAPATPIISVSWAEPMFGLSNMMIPQLYVDGGSGPELVSGLNIATPTNPVVLASLTSETRSVQGDVELVIMRPINPDLPITAPAIWTSLEDGTDELAAREHHLSVGADTVGLVSNGHAADGSAIGVAAVNWRTPDSPESFTSPGAGTMYFEPVQFGPDAQSVPAPAYAQPLSTPGPQIAAVNGNRTNFFGGAIDGEPGWYFFGTSAAAPNAAAVHALALQYAPGLTADHIAQTAFATTNALRNPLAPAITDAEYFGSGLINAHALLNQLPPHASTELQATALSATHIGVEWDARNGATGYRVELLRGDSPVASIDTDASTTVTTFDGLLPETSYTVRLTVIGAGGTSPAITAEVTTPRPPVPATPTAPAANDMSPQPTPGFAASPTTVTAGGNVTVTGLPNLAWVHGWLFSDPAALGWAWTGASGSVSFTVPANTPAGAHRLALSDADGALLGWVNLTVAASAVVPNDEPATVPAVVHASADLARTGTADHLSPIIGVGALVLLAGGALAIRSALRVRRS